MFNSYEFIIKKTKLVDIYIKKYLKYFYIKRYFFYSKCNFKDFQFANLIEILKLCVFY